MGIIIEIAVDTLEDALTAERGGAQRIELCSDLLSDGLSPSTELLKQVRSSITIPIFVMVRSRAGDFYYSDAEFLQMKSEIQIFKSLGADGIVVGILNDNRTVNADRTAELIQCAQPLEVTFHRAFDVAADPFDAIDVIMKTGARRLLTSGQQPRAVDGLPLIAKLKERTNGRITIMPGAGIDHTNIRQIISSVSAEEIHIGKGVKTVNSKGFYRVSEKKLRDLVVSVQ